MESKKKIIVLGSIIVLSLLIIGCDSQTPREKHYICERSCLDDGWQYGEWVGYQFCNCYNRTIVNEIEYMEE